MRVTLILASCIWIVQPGRAETIEDWQRAAAEMVDELSDCEAYYAFIKACAEHSDTSVARTAASGASQAFDMASKDVYLIGQMAKMSNEALLATLKLSLERVKDETDSGCQNMAVEIVKRAKVCKALVEHPQDELMRRATASGAK